MENSRHNDLYIKHLLLVSMSEKQLHKSILQPLLKLSDEHEMTDMGSICLPNIAKAIFI